jgi:hypothetical protein
MDLAESGLVTVIKGRGAEIFSKLRPPPVLREPLNILRNLVQLIAIRILISNADIKIHCAIE